MNWRFLVVAFVATACTDTGTGIVGGGIEDGAARVLVLTDGGELVEYSAPPLVETRRFDLNSALAPYRQFVALNSDSGGFFAYEVPPGPPFGPRGWNLVRYNRNWVESARKPVSDYIGQDTVAPEAFQLSADGRFLVAHVPVRSVAGLPPQILVLNAATLEIVRQTNTGSRFPYMAGGPTTATGAQVLLMNYAAGCGAALWLDAETNAVADSVALPCGFIPLGFQTRRRLYVIPPSGDQYASLMIFDATAGQIAATQGTVPVSGIVADPVGGRIIGVGRSGIVVMNSQSLAVLGVVVTDQDTTTLEDGVRLGTVDPVSGAFVADLFGTGVCPSCYGRPTVITVIDLDRREVVLRQDLGTGVMIVR